MKNSKNSLVTIIAIAVLCGVIGFFGGMQFQKSNNQSTANVFSMNGGRL
jgi:cobyrinic acid a,c-diamide synthase